MKNDNSIHFIEQLNDISTDDWQKLNSSPCPFLRYDFFNALENTGCASAKKGWQAHHLIKKSHGEVTAILPMYLKSHSWGEYVFDWDWAEAFERYQLNYYPKLVATIPFTPVSSDKLLSSTGEMDEVFEPLISHCEHNNINSWHILFCDEIATELPEDVYERNTVQFHWFNHDFRTFDHFLMTFTSRKRKNTRKERQSIVDQGIQIRALTKNEITEKDLKFFYLTYQLTYLKRGHKPHLNEAFFKQTLSDMNENMLLVIANDEQEDIACALFFYDDEQLFGRYWGCIKQVNNLHFELCYYQGIEFCINNKLQKFNPGTQGEHKIQRGFEPILTYSYHWIKHQVFKEPIKNFCLQEQKHMLAYQQQCRELLPFKNKLTK